MLRGRQAGITTNLYTPGDLRAANAHAKSQASA